MPDKAQVSDVLRSLWRDFDFRPNAEQEAAILHTDGPLFLPAGPGSGKTRVLLWRTVNLITAHGVKPEEIFLSTFTEKAALQLHNGLRTLLSAVSDATGQPYDTAKLYVGTVHSLCRRMLADRRFSSNRDRTRPPVLLDELDQYMFVRKQAAWAKLLAATGYADAGQLLAALNDFGASKHKAIGHLIGFFNRLSEEMLDPKVALKRARDKETKALVKGYAVYRDLLRTSERVAFTDLSLLQSAALEHLVANPVSASVFRHVVVDEYQDTNPVQERLFFHLASGHKNFCVVGDDDQALYRFRGATVENFVDFPNRCEKQLKRRPTRILLNTNYRSREDIVEFYNRFMIHPTCDWRKKPRGAFRVMDKKIIPHRKDHHTAVVASSAGAPEDVATEVAQLARQLVDSKKVADPSQIAFLFPSLKSPNVTRMRDALADVGLEVYAPRAGQFLAVPEAAAIFGALFQIFGKYSHVHTEFNGWINQVRATADGLAGADRHLRDFIKQKQAEVEITAKDYGLLAATMNANGWVKETPFDPTAMLPALRATNGLSATAKRTLAGRLFRHFAQERLKNGKPFSLSYVVLRAASLDWNVLDIFYQLSGFKHFKAMFDLAERGGDEGQVCNLSLVSRYLSRFLDHYPSLVSGESLGNGRFLGIFANYLYALFRRGESEYEDAEDPFPRGRVPFITIHQSKGLEFPVVILANARKDPKLQPMEARVAPLHQRDGEPLDRMPQFDVMRMFYVALSRAKNLLVVTHYKGPGQRLHPTFADMLDGTFPRIPAFDVSTVPAAALEDEELPKSYSYTADFLLYERCPRQYMLFRTYGFAPARSLTMFFGSLVHQSIEDLHQRLIGLKGRVA